MELAATTLVFAGLIATGLMAGLFFGWSVSAVPGLADVSDNTYVTSMQSINRAILNPLFLVTFLGALLLLVAATVVSFLAGSTGRGWWLAAASATYAVGVVGVTITRNVPLNEVLAGFDRDSASDEALARQRQNYEPPWNRWQSVRTVAVVAAFSLAAIAALTGADVA